MSKPIHLTYKIDKYAGLDAPIAVVQTKYKMLKDWTPDHWHLDSVYETDEFYNISFTAIPSGNWESDE
jgi:hypothetical protein